VEAPIAFARVQTILTGWSGSPALNTFYWVGAGPVLTQAEINEAASRVRAFWAAAAGLLPAGVQVNVQPSVDILEQTTGELTGSLAVGPALAVVNGSGVGEFYAPGIMAMLTLETNVTIARRRLRGRSYIGPLTETGVTSGTLSPASVASLNTAAAPLLATTPTAIKLSVWSRPKPGTPGRAVTVQSVSTQPKLAHLRSRRD
jgi:hypothetical protein